MGAGQRLKASNGAGSAASSSCGAGNSYDVAGKSIRRLIHRRQRHLAAPEMAMQSKQRRDGAMDVKKRDSTFPPPPKIVIANHQNQFESIWMVAHSLAFSSLRRRRWQWRAPEGASKRRKQCIGSQYWRNKGYQETTFLLKIFCQNHKQ